jgi:tRNA threonylcarbamoyladenosine biosynthesis protein TsaB
MAYILNIETATKNCSVALSFEGVLLAGRDYAAEGYSHAEKLHILIEEVMQEAAVTYKQLQAIAVSKGPGSYTGLRIGVSAAKGLCYALDIPLIAIDTLKILAHGAPAVQGLLLPLLDARRMEVYSAVYSSDHQEVEPVKATIVDENSFQHLAPPYYYFGDGSEKCIPFLKAGIWLKQPKYPSASHMVALSYQAYKISDTVSVAYFEPYYLKDFIINKKN